MNKLIRSALALTIFGFVATSCTKNPELVIPSSTASQGSTLTPFVYATFQGAKWNVTNPTYFFDSSDTTITVSASSTNASLTFVVYNSDINKSLKSAVAIYNSKVYFFSSGSVSLNSASSANAVGASGKFSLTFSDYDPDFPALIEFKDGSFYAKP